MKTKKEIVVGSGISSFIYFKIIKKEKLEFMQVLMTTLLKVKIFMNMTL